MAFNVFWRLQEKSWLSLLKSYNGTSNGFWLWRREKEKEKKWNRNLIRTRQKYLKKKKIQRQKWSEDEIWNNKIKIKIYKRNFKKISKTRSSKM